MPKLRYKVEELPPEDERDDGRDFKVTDLKITDERYGPDTYTVWVSDRFGSAGCSHCQTPLRGMSGSCAHAQAVRRHLKKERDGVKLAEINEEVAEIFSRPPEACQPECSHWKQESDNKFYCIKCGKELSDDD